VLAWERVEHEYQTADIFVLPSHSTPPFTILDAMSYELPVVTIDAWANAEIVDDGRTGLVVRRSRRVPYYFKDSPHPRYGTDPWLRAIQTPDPRVVDDLAAAVARLIDDPALRRRLGAAARHEVEHGRFSIAHRNAGLKRMFDEALASPVRAAGEDA
jgi:glycosyltransferase involved in cell wall biosynthesis